MTELINSGDRQALKELLAQYTKPVYDRISAACGADSAKSLTRLALGDIIVAAEQGVCPPDAQLEEWIFGLADKRIADAMDVRTRADALICDAAQPAEHTTRAMPDSRRDDWQPPAFAAAWTPPEINTAWTPPPAQPIQPAAPARTAAPVQSPRSAPAATQAPAAAHTVPTLFDNGTAYDCDDDDDYDDDDYDDERDSGKKSFGMVLLIIMLVLMIAALVWMLVVMLMTRGVLPMLDFGFAEWFNGNVFQLY